MILFKKYYTNLKFIPVNIEKEKSEYDKLDF